MKAQIYEVEMALPLAAQQLVVPGRESELAASFQDRFLRNAIRVATRMDQFSLEGIRQFYVFVDKEVPHFSTSISSYQSVS